MNLSTRSGDSLHSRRPAAWERGGSRVEEEGHDPPIHLPAFALGLLIATAAAGQHHHAVNSKMDYDDPSGGDPNPPAGCTGVQAKITIGLSGTSFSPATITVDAGTAGLLDMVGDPSQHNIKGRRWLVHQRPAGPRAAPSSALSTSRAPTAITARSTAAPRAACAAPSSSAVARGGRRSWRRAWKLELSPTYTVSEGAGTLTVTVERTGGSDGAATVKIATAPGSAKPGKDFTTRNGTLSWANGDQAPKTFQVPIKNDTAPEPNETFAVKLSKATGAAMGTSTATVTIQDDDSARLRREPRRSRAAPGSGAVRQRDPPHLGRRVDRGQLVRIERREPGGTFQEIASVAGRHQPLHRLRTARRRHLPVPGPCRGDRRRLGLLRHRRRRHRRLDGGLRRDPRPLPPRRPVRSDVEWQSGGREAKRLTLPGTVRSGGLFALSAEGAPQLLLNVSDGCAVNGHFGIDFAAVTDAEFTVKVRDTHTGRTWVYFNPEGSVPAPVRDVDAFSPANRSSPPSRAGPLPALPLFCRPQRAN